jgi:hypothetical protein
LTAYSQTFRQGIFRKSETNFAKNTKLNNVLRPGQAGVGFHLHGACPFLKLLERKKMKLNEIMIIREDGLKIFQADDSTLAKLRRIRGNLYADDPRLRTVTDMPTMTQSQIPEMSPEMQARAEAAYQIYLAGKADASKALPVVPQPMSFEEQLKHDWRFNPGIRKEFASQASYEAFKRAEKAGKAKCYGKA